jgi:cell division initiation protein
MAVRGIVAYFRAMTRSEAQPAGAGRRERRLLLRFCAGTHERPSRPRDGAATRLASRLAAVTLKGRPAATRESAAARPAEETSMKVTPLDLRQAQFRSKLRGFDPDEVTPFLADAAYELEQALKEIDRLRQEAAKTEVVLDEFRERENALRNTLLTAQRLADQIKENAETESRTILREAENRADLLLQKAQGRLTELDRDINEMRVRRRDVESSLEGAIASLSYALDFMRTQDHQSERDEKLLLHRPKMDAATAQVPVARPA